MMSAFAFQRQPAQRGRAIEAQLRRFMGTKGGRKEAYAAHLVEAPDLEDMPRPLDLRRFEPLAPRFACNCSRDRVRGMLRGLGREEVQSILAERGDVEIGCEFCGTQYRFDAVDVGDVFIPVADRLPGSGSLN